jgi:chemotaxis signal transduction protein
MLNSKGLSTERQNYLTFFLKDRLCAVKLNVVLEVINVPKIYPLPLAAEGVLGLINHRGTIYPLLSLAKALGLEEEGIDASKRIALLQSPELKAAVLIGKPSGLRGSLPQDAQLIEVKKLTSIGKIR